MRCLIIDNYDSFTWNLADYVAQIFCTEPLVIYNDQYNWEEIRELGEFDSIIISPGPGSVTIDADFNVCRQALDQNEIPVLGVCLGFQGLAHLYGGEITHAPVPYHGRKSHVRHNDSALFKGIPLEFEAVRYHSLMVSFDSVPSDIEITAQTGCGLVMAIQHKHLPKWGVQFHPESILTEYGMNLISNFRDLCYEHANKTVPAQMHASWETESNKRKTSVEVGNDPARARMISKKITTDLDPEEVFLNLYADRKNCFWLDSQSIREGMSRFSFMGSVGDEGVISYSIPSDTSDYQLGRAFLNDLEERLENTRVETDESLPFEFNGGYIGYMTYEMKELFGARTRHKNQIPDAVWLRADHFIAFDHVTGDLWLVALSGPRQEDVARRWIDETEAKLSRCRAKERRFDTLGIDKISIDMDLSKEGYLKAIDECKKKIVDGESYEICLTNQFSFTLKLDPVKLYRIMRRGNPAPFGAFIRCGDYCILSTSPERFLKVDKNGAVQTKPIKGTCARSDVPYIDENNAKVLASSEKDQAENLMIVDLMRNDLGKVSMPGSVVVSKLMEIESYHTVHQMVSTVESKLKPGCTLVDLLKSVFPGGSITGAPKHRSMEIIDQLENDSRGVYCGSIGYLGYNRIADLNIAIRSLSYDGETVKFGAGGAITYLSDPEKEFDEIILKVEAVLKPVWNYINQLDSRFECELVNNLASLNSVISPMAEQV
jgi:para-aminobenzoate synthetase